MRLFSCIETYLINGLISLQTKWSNRILSFDIAKLHTGNKIEFSCLNATIGSLPKCVQNITKYGQFAYNMIY